MRVLVTGAAGFIASYVVGELLNAGYRVVGVDDFSKYGPLSRSHDDHPAYTFITGDAKDVTLLRGLIADCDVLVAAAGRVGGIGYFHQLPYDLLAENERITAAAFDAAIWAHRERTLQRVVVVSSSMVFESAVEFPTREGAQLDSPPPRSAYGFQKLSCEYFARAAWEQYHLPYTVVRPFNCVGIGEWTPVSDDRIRSGNISQAVSHVLPDLVLKVLAGQDPLHILGSGRQVRHFTYGGDLARGIRLCIENTRAVNEDFNLSTAVGTTVLELAEKVWVRIRRDRPFRYVSDAPLPHDVQVRIPDVNKARMVLGFEATTPLDTILDEVIPWVDQQFRAGRVRCAF